MGADELDPDGMDFAFSILAAVPHAAARAIWPL
jgi:hypothetical protein